MKRFIVGFVMLFVMLSLEVPAVNGAIVTADVAVSSPDGQYTLLAVDEFVATNWTRYYWDELPAFAVEQDVLFWQYTPTAFPSVADGITTFEVLDNGPVLMACTIRWGGGGNDSGGWVPELTTRAELEAQGWAEFATGLKDTRLSGEVQEYVVFRRDSIAGEVFTYRTEKYRPPIIIRSVITVPEPSSMVLCSVLTGFGITMGLRRRFFC